MKQNIRLIFSLTTMFLALVLSPAISMAVDDVQELLDFLQSETPPPAPLVLAASGH